MRTVKTSNGLEWDSDGTAFLDVVAAPPLPAPLALARVLDALPRMDWRPWDPRLSPAHDLSSFRGVMGVPPRGGFHVRYIWRKGVTPLDGLYGIEAIDPIPAALAAACLTAASTDLGRDEAQAAVRLYTGMAAGLGEPDAPAPRLSRAALDAAVAQYVRDELAGREPTVLPGSTNRARFLLALGAHLWQPATLAAVGVEPDLGRSRALNAVAVAYAALNPDAAVYPAGRTTVRCPVLLGGSTWSEACNWAVRRINPEAARLFAGFAADDPSWILGQHLPSVDTQRADAIAAGLLREAAQRQVYIASGQFVLALPEHLPWAGAGITALAIHAEPDGLWCAGLTPRRARTASWWWSPAMQVADLLQLTMPASALVHVTLAAFWHDLVTAGDTVVIASGQQRPAPGVPAAPQPKRSATPTVTLPRRAVHITGVRQWSSAEDREVIIRRTHGVRGHLRQLPDRWARSESAEHEAVEWGFVLPDGYTFVRPHLRGGHDGDPAPVVARARGLQTISALL